MVPVAGSETADRNNNGAEVFATTCWTVVIAAQAHQNQRASAENALAQLCEAYWRPLFVFLLRQGLSYHDAKDLVQGFFEQFLQHNYLREIGREKGRFRSFLLACLQHYRANVHRNQNTQRRGGKVIHLSFEESGMVSGYEIPSYSEQPAEACYDRAWGESVMALALKRLRSEYVSSGRGELYALIAPWLAAVVPNGEYERAAAGTPWSAGALAVAVHRLRQRFHELVRAAVAQTVQSPGEIDAELQYLARVLVAV